MTYRTKQKDKILTLIEKQKQAFTVKDIYDSMNGEIGLTTIYRLIDKLVKDGYLNKTIGEDNNTYYEYLAKCDSANHFYLKCQKCGSLIHVDCDCINDLANHISKNHKFTVLNEHIIINGICNECMKKEKVS